jgi:hypothetical protein
MSLFITKPTTIINPTIVPRFRPTYTVYDDVIINPVLRSVTLPRYENLNYNVDVKRKVTEYFHRKTIEKWILNDLSNLMAFLKMNNGKVVVVDTIDEYKKNKGKMENIHEKKRFIGKYVLLKSDVKRIIEKESYKYNVDIFNLYKQPYRKMIREKIEQLIKHKFILSIEKK